MPHRNLNRRAAATWCCTIIMVAGSTVRAGDCELTAELVGENIDLADGVTTNIGGVSAAYNGTADEYLVVWFDSRITGQNDVYAQRVSASGMLTGGNTTIISGSNSQTDTSTAYSPVTNRFYVTWRNQGGPPGSSGFNHAFGRLVSALGLPIGSPIDVSNGGLEATLTYNDLEDQYFLEARNFAGGGISGIRGQRVSNGGTLIGAGITIATSGAPAPAGQVAYNVNHNQYLATWRDQVASDLKGRIINADGSLAGVVFQISPVFPTSGLAASVAFDPAGDRYLVVFGTFSGGPLHGQFVTSSGALDGPDFIILETTANVDAFVSYDGVNQVYLAAWRIAGNITAQLLADDGTALGDQVSIVAGSASGAPRAAANSNQGGFIVTWIDNRHQPDGHRDTFAQIVAIAATCVGDMDGDGDVDLFDFERFLECVTGPNGGPVSPTCGDADTDNDDDVDFADFAILQTAFSGSL